MTLWFHPRPLDDPQVLCLTEGRSLRENDYGIAARQIFLPDLSKVLPSLPLRVGDTWKVPVAGTKVLLGDRSASGDGLTGKLVEVRKGGKEGQWVAVLSLTGRAVVGPNGSMAVNARLLFTFTEPEPPEARKDKEDEAKVDALGGITEVRMAQTATGPLTSGSNERLRLTRTRELVLERHLEDAGAPLPVPNPLPQATEENSWLTYENPDGLFHFRFPQELKRPPPAEQPDDGSIELLDRWPNPGTRSA